MKFIYILAVSILFTSHVCAQKTLQFQQTKDEYGILTRPFLQQLREIFNISTFVETGTFYGATTAVAASIFDSVHTTEIGDWLFNHARQYLADKKHVHLYLGDSAGQLAVILRSVKTPVIFFLDAHYSGDGTAKNGFENCPTMRELAMIKRLGNPHSVILIDDIRFFQNQSIVESQRQAAPHDKAIGGYPPLSLLIKTLARINPSYRCIIFGDILMAFPSELNIHVSPVLEAMTISRMSTDGECSKTLKAEEIASAEAIVAQAQGQELDGIRWLAQSNLSRNQPIFAEKYLLWHDLVQQNQ